METIETSLDPIILIEDEDTLLKVYVDILEKSIPEYELLPYHDGIEGLKAIKEKSAALIITDLRLPGIDGLKILSEATKLNPHVPIIVVSSFFGLDQIKETIGDAKNITFISKPFDVTVLGSFVETLLTTDADSTISGISLLNIIQMISADQKSCYLEMLEGDQSGVVSFTQGSIRFARTGQYRGIDAVKKISEWSSPVIMIFNNRNTTKVNMEDVTTESLLLELVQHLDQNKTA